MRCIGRERWQKNPLLPYLPKSETRCAEEMSARLDPDILAVFRTDFAQLERGAHLAVQLVLFLGHFDVVLRRGLYGFAQVGVFVPTVRVKVAEKPTYP